MTLYIPRIDIANGYVERVTYNEALKYVSAEVAGAALKAVAQSEVARFAEAYRAALATANAGKLQEYRIKEAIAADPASASEAENAILDREAAARGTDRAALLADISAKVVAYHQIALLIGALEAEANAAIAAVADGAPDIETQVLTVLAAKKAEAESEYQNALALMAG